MEQQQPVRCSLLDGGRCGLRCRLWTVECVRRWYANRIGGAHPPAGTAGDSSSASGTLIRWSFLVQTVAVVPRQWSVTGGRARHEHRRRYPGSSAAATASTLMRGRLAAPPGEVCGGTGADPLDAGTTPDPDGVASAGFLGAAMNRPLTARYTTATTMQERCAYPVRGLLMACCTRTS